MTDTYLTEFAFAADSITSKNARKADSPDHPALRLAYLSEDPQVWMNAAENPHCPADALAKLADKNLLGLTMIVAQNPHCPADLLRQYAVDGNLTIREAVSKNPTIPGAVRRQIAQSVTRDRRAQSHLFAVAAAGASRTPFESARRGVSTPAAASEF